MRIQRDYRERHRAKSEKPSRDRKGSARTNAEPLHDAWPILPVQGSEWQGMALPHGVNY
jgi:hypothetical protein